MNHRTSLAALLALAVLLSHHPAAANASATRPEPTVGWKPCPEYSDEVIRALGMSAEQVPAFRAQMKRLRCGTVSVPLDHADPGGRQISVAVTRLAASDRARRLGAVTVLPGGPGNSGYLDPVRMMLRNEQMARLNERYDLIGLDPRGVNNSTKVACERNPGGMPGPGPLTEETARTIYAAQVAANQACGNSDPAFLGRLTTENVARDLDLIRTAMGERELSLLGLSWGSRLGMVYRGMFPGRTARVFLDSVPPPWTRLDEHVKGSARAAERNFGRMAAWLARNDAIYGLGATARQVHDAVVKLGRDYDNRPRTFTDLQRPIDGSAIADLARRNSTEWARAGKALTELRDATGPTAPPAVKELFASMGAPVPGMPETLNITMNRAVKCNEDSSRVGFTAAWKAYQQRVERLPATGRAWGLAVECAGWPLPVQEGPVKRGRGSLVLSGHLHEFMSVYDWTLQTRRAIGGTVYTVADDVHVSATRVPDCAADVVTYFDTGRIDRGCPGMS
ncbi:alpha/beta fold hydrolase [Nonomuraea sp. NPDC049709]|uniref:alpha/beta fold hydrolase n=1 Tax=Nonomuraea sp. NPDC049709 TaxID=3154736 RepID=UPI0034175722